MISDADKRRADEAWRKAERDLYYRKWIWARVRLWLFLIVIFALLYFTGWDGFL